MKARRRYFLGAAAALLPRDGVPALERAKVKGAHDGHRLARSHGWSVIPACRREMVSEEVYRPQGFKL